MARPSGRRHPPDLERQIIRAWPPHIVNILSIGGSDPSSASGVQGDVRLAASAGDHCPCVITAITSQNTRSFGGFEPVSAGMVKAQLEYIISDFEISGVKIGMTGGPEQMKVIAEFVKDMEAPVVVDPVVRSTTGGVLLAEADMDRYRKNIVPLATIITPNMHEAGILAGAGELRDMAGRIKGMGAGSVIVTGITDGKTIYDYILDGTQDPPKWSSVPGPLVRHESRGGGGMHSTHVLLSLISGHTMPEAAYHARQAAYHSICDAKEYGSGLRITDGAELMAAISEASALPGMARMIPECQTNFVHSTPGPKDIADVLGISGRLVRAGDDVVMAGSLRYGASKHVASALIAASKRFPDIRSAINVRYSPDIISRAKRAGMRVTSYDRSGEPPGVSSVSWGTEQAVSGGTEQPDITYHEGAHGKEPMIILYAGSPGDIVQKLARLIET